MNRLKILNYKSYSHIHITVDDGWIILSGPVKNKTEREIVDKVASNVLWVQTMINKITVIPMSDAMDTSIAKEVVDAIDQNEDINMEHVVVEVKDKVFTLEGNVHTWRSKDKASEAVHSIDHTERMYIIYNGLRGTYA